MSGLYVYGIVGADHPCELQQLDGVGSPPSALRRVCGSNGAVAAVVSKAPADLRGKRRDLTAHQRVVEALAEQGTVLPMRFGVVAEAEAILASSLSNETDHYLELLAELAGLVELDLKAIPNETEFIAASVRDRGVQSALARARRDDSYDSQVELGQLVAAAVDSRRQTCGEQVLGMLRPLAARSTLLSAGDTYALNAAFLVDRKEVPDFIDAVERLRQTTEPSLEFRLVGPLPPYSFVGS